MAHDFRLREIATAIALGGESLKEVGFPDDWEYNPFLMGYEKDGYESECNGEKTREKFFLSYKQVQEIKYNDR